jgi:nitroreductase
MSLREFIVFNALYARRSIRNFKSNKKVEEYKITKLLKAAMAAPSACNIQPWDFVVIDDGELITRIKNSIEQYGNYNTPVVMVITGDNSNIPWKDHGIIDCAVAMENVMIAAPTLGLGTVCIGGFNRTKIKEILELPEEVEAIGMLYIGYPNEKRKPRTKYIKEAFHKNKYDNTRAHKPRTGDIIAFGPNASI